MLKIPCRLNIFEVKNMKKPALEKFEFFYCHTAKGGGTSSFCPKKRIPLQKNGILQDSRSADQRMVKPPSMAMVIPVM